MTKPATTLGSVQPSAGPSMMPNSRPPRPMIDSAAPSGSRAPWLGSFDVGMRKNPATRAMSGDRDVDPEHRAPPEVLEQQPAGHRTDRHAEPGEAGPHGDRPAPLAGVTEDVGEDRQRRRHDQRPADAHERPAEDQLRRRVGHRRRDRAERRTRAARSAGRPCGRSGRSGCPSSAAGRRTRARRRRGSTGCRCSTRGGPRSSIGIATLRIVLSSVMISSEMHSVARISHRRAWTFGSIGSSTIVIACVATCVLACAGAASHCSVGGGDSDTERSSIVKSDRRMTSKRTAVTLVATEPAAGLVT